MILDADFWQFQSNFGESWRSGGDDDAAGRRHGPHRRGVRPRSSAARSPMARKFVHFAAAGNGARIVWRDGRTGRARAIEAPLVVVTIPLPVLRTIPADFSPDIRAAIEAVDYVPAVKVAFQAERRFWELDDAIYGGISWTTRDITQVWYPSAGIHQRKGILVGAYIWSDDLGEKFAAMSPAQRASRPHWTMANGCIRTIAGTLTKGVVGRLEEHPVQRIGLGGMEQRCTGGTLRAAAEGRWPVPVRRRAHVLHQRLAGRRGPFGALLAAADRRANVRLNVNCYSAAATPACCGSTVSSRSRGATSRPNSVMFSIGVRVVEEPALAEEQQMADAAHAGGKVPDLVEHVVRRAGEHGVGVHELLHGGACGDRSCCRCRSFTMRCARGPPCMIATLAPIEL